MILGSFQFFSAPHAVRWIGYTDECEHLELHTLSESFRMWKRSLWLIALLIWETSSESEHREMCQVDEQSRRCTETCWTPGNFRRPKQVFLIFFFVEVERNLWLEIFQHGAVKSAIVETYLFMSAFSSSALLRWLINIFTIFQMRSFTVPYLRQNHRLVKCLIVHDAIIHQLYLYEDSCQIIGKKWTGHRCEPDMPFNMIWVNLNLNIPKQWALI